jgi:hypothetical protein
MSAACLWKRKQVVKDAKGVLASQRNAQESRQCPKALHNEVQFQVRESRDRIVKTMRRMSVAIGSRLETDVTSTSLPRRPPYRKRLAGFYMDRIHLDIPHA